MSVIDDMPVRETPTQRLARSLFGFGLLACIIGVVAWLALLFSPTSPDATFAQLRVWIIVLFGVLVLTLVAFTVWTLRAETSHLEAVAQVITRIFRVWIIALIIGLILFEINIVLASALRDVAPSIIEPLRFAFGGWTLVIIMMMITLQWDKLKKWFSSTSGTWAQLGFAIVLLAVIGGLFALTAAVVQRTGINNQLRGSLDYREIAFIDDGEQPSSSEFWQEQSQTRVRWSPYTYWVVDQLQGQYIRVDATGLRATFDQNIPTDAPVLGVFGGSTVWGEGARDNYTIPSQIANLLLAKDTPYRVINYGQTGYVSTQDLLLFQMQLLNDNVPNVAIFYGGFNDVLSAYSQNITGVTLQESQRLSDSEAGRLLRIGQPILRPVTENLSQYDLSLVSSNDGSAQSIVTRYLANVQMIATLAQAYDVQVLFVWQPSIIYKNQLIEGEVGADQRMRTERAGFAELYADADQLLRAQLAQDNPHNILLLSDLFKDDDRPLFYDLVHITEEGNQSVAQAIVDALP
jgi:lysophospholipase L1-like esterase